MKKSILITGVAGLLGSRMADWIIENHPEYEVVGVDNLFGGYIENVNDKVIFYKRELSKDSLTDIFDKHEFEYVYHFAAYAAEGLSIFMPSFNWENNMQSTSNIVTECINHKIKRLVYTSSMSVYGPGVKDGVPFDEDIALNPQDPYAISKSACEKHIQCMCDHFGVDWCIIRPHNVYGIKQNIWDKYRNVLGIWMLQRLKGEPIIIYGDGEQTRAFSYIDDCLKPMWNAATYDKASKEIINLGGMHGCSINEAANILAEVIDGTEIVHKESRYEIKHAVPSFQKSVDILDYEEKTTLKEGIKEMWEWAKQQPKRRQYKWENYEISDGLYSYWQ